MVFVRPCHWSFSRLQRKLWTAISGTATATRSSTDAASHVWMPPMLMPSMPTRFGSIPGFCSSTSSSRHRSQQVS